MPRPREDHCRAFPRMLRSGQLLPHSHALLQCLGAAAAHLERKSTPELRGVVAACGTRQPLDQVEAHDGRAVHAKEPECDAGDAAAPSAIGCFGRRAPHRFVASDHSRRDYFGAAVEGTMMCAYGVPFHITNGPPFFGSAETPFSIRGSGTSTMMCGPPSWIH